MVGGGVNSIFQNRRAGADTITITRNEILTGFNEPEQYILVLVEVGDDDQAREPRYVRQPFNKEPDFGVTSVNYDLKELLSRSSIAS